LLENDIRFAPFQIVGLEKDFVANYQVVSDEKTYQIRIGGIIDRLDQTADGLRIIDYKTGRNMKLDFKDWPQLVDRNYFDRRKEIFQTLIYSDIVNRTENHTAIFPVIYKLDDLFDEDFVPSVMFQGEKLSFHLVADQFNEIFTEVLSEMFSGTNIYDQTKDLQKCSYCPYNKICRR
jgi:ATP-dependent helicase/DNAse subunit B